MPGFNKMPDAETPTPLSPMPIQAHVVKDPYPMSSTPITPSQKFKAESRGAVLMMLCYYF